MNAFDVIIIGFGKGGKTLAAEFAKRGRKVTIRIPQKGLKEKLVELAARNAQLVLSQDCLLYTSPSPRD